MDNNKDKNKIILKKEELPGVDMSVSDFTQLHTVQVTWSKVTKKMYKEKRQTFIGLKDTLNVGEVIQVGNLGLKYRVLKLSKVTDTEGYIHRIKRIDDKSITLTDIDAIKEGGKVRIVNRRSFQKKMNFSQELREGNPIESTVDSCEADVCEPGKVTIPNVNTNPTCYTYEIIIEPNFSAVITYTDCEGEEQSIEISVATEVQNQTICASNEDPVTAVVTDSATSDEETYELTPIEPCEDVVCKQYTITAGRSGADVTYVDCSGITRSESLSFFTEVLVICAKLDTVVVEGFNVNVTTGEDCS